MRWTPCGRVLAIVLVAASVGATQLVVPVEQEPNHRTVFENAWLRVLDVRFGPGVESGFHRHALNNVAVRIVGGTTRADPLGGEGRPLVVPTGRVVFYSASPPYEHRVVNVGVAAVHIVDVELYGAPAVRDASAADGLAGHLVEVENAHVRVSRVRLAPGASLPPHTHPRGWLDVVVTGATPGAVAWHAAGTYASVSQTGAAIELIEIEPR